MAMDLKEIEKYIKEALESILNQTYENFELLILDDFSTDNSIEIIKSFDDKKAAIRSPIGV